MQELITTFHIDWKLMVAQVVNFGLVFWAIYMLAAKPLSRLVKNRTEEITTGLENAKKAETDLAEAHVKKGEIVREAKNEAKKILDVSHADGKEIIKEAKEKASVEKEDIIKQARIDAEKEKKHAEEEVRREAAELVKDGMKKVMESYVSKGKGEDIIKAMLNS